MSSYQNNNTEDEKNKFEIAQGNDQVDTNLKDNDLDEQGSDDSFEEEDQDIEDKEVNEELVDGVLPEDKDQKNSKDSSEVKHSLKNVKSKEEIEAEYLKKLEEKRALQKIEFGKHINLFKSRVTDSGLSKNVAEAIQDLIEYLVSSSLTNINDDIRYLKKVTIRSSRPSSVPSRGERQPSRSFRRDDSRPPRERSFERPERQDRYDSRDSRDRSSRDTRPPQRTDSRDDYYSRPSDRNDRHSSRQPSYRGGGSRFDSR